ncbi:MAG: 2-C-methyl-D-erythritol 4-phosphate cytidylyltransferase [Candidatus Obscuribacterales bacterium]|nr:2-C-methyl-D-erythritol 4-phosphate cytidylyltransferase [Steroidobacteraceae bacterium]
MSQSGKASYWVVIPAAGVGRRMAGDMPKQYLPLNGRTVIEWSIAVFLARADVSGIVVAIAANDGHWSTLSCSRDSRVRTALGGDERAASVLSALNSLAAEAHDDDWVIVHDAARPCLNPQDLSRLISELAGDQVGGLLASPVADTLKSADSEQRVAATVSRGGLWRALTPQMFRFGVLRRALALAAERGMLVTDEASAIEILALRPKLIVGRADNIKITLPEDLVIAEKLLRGTHP